MSRGTRHITLVRDVHGGPVAVAAGKVAMWESAGRTTRASIDDGTRRRAGERKERKG